MPEFGYQPRGGKVGHTPRPGICSLWSRLYRFFRMEDLGPKEGPEEMNKQPKANGLAF
jgi:hypothetical protein